MRFALGLIFSCSLAMAQSPKDLLSALPLRFEQHTNGSWIARGAGYAVGLKGNRVTLALGRRGVGLSFEGAAQNVPLRGENAFEARANYFTSQGYNSASIFGRVQAQELYPGVGITYYGTGANLEYDFTLSPGADPSQIRMRFEGADSVALNGNGEIVLGLGSDSIIQKKPEVYQRGGVGELVAVESRYTLGEDGSVGVVLGNYDASKAVVIDPTLTYSAYLGGSGSDLAVVATRDPSGAIFIGGQTYSNDLPFGPNSYNFIFQEGSVFAFVMKLDLTKTGNDVLQYTTYFGGLGTQSLAGLAVDSSEKIYLTGMTDSVALPVSSTNTPFQTTLDANFPHPYVAVIDTTINGSGGLIYGTFLGGTKAEQVTSIATYNGLAYVTGYTASDDFPMANAIQSTRLGGNDTFISVLNPNASGSASLVYSTYLGGTAADIARSIAVASDGTIYTTGYTYSKDLTVTDGAYLGNYSGGGDVFLFHLDYAKNVLLYSTYIAGTSFDEAKKVLLLPGGQVALTGYTLSDDYVVTQNAYQWVNKGLTGNAFLTVLDPSKRGTSAIVYSTFFGGSGGEVAYDLRTDAKGRFYLCGYTLSSDFPVTNSALNPTPDPNSGFNGFVAVLDPKALPGSALVYGSYVTSSGTQICYGVELDNAGNVYLTGYTTGSIFPAGAAVHNNGDGNFDPYLLGFSLP